MKKTIAILLVLIIGMVGVFADGTDPVDTSKKLTLTTKVGEQSFFLITNSPYNETSFNNMVNGAAANDTADTKAVGSEGIDSTYLTLGTNMSGSFAISITSLPALSISGVDSKIHYTLNIADEGGTISLSTDVAEFTTTEVASISGAGGAQVKSLPITVTLDSVSYNNAQATAADEVYSADVVFDISSP